MSFGVDDRLDAVADTVARLFFEHYAPRVASGAPLGSNGWFAPAPDGTGAGV